MIIRLSLLAVCTALIIGTSSCDTQSSDSEACYQWEFDSVSANFSQYVDPFIGTGGHGHTFPGATAPFGMVQLSPDTRIDGSWDGCSGYHYSDSIIYGFSHTHLSGTGCSDYGDIMLMPGQGEKMFVAGNDSVKGYRTSFTHANEKAEAGYYSVKLNNGINCEMTASPRVGVHRYKFNGNEPSWIILDMSHRDEVLECEIEIVNDHTIRGKRFSKAWATNQQLWFYAEFSQPFKHELWSKGAVNGSDTITAKDAKALLSFEAQEVEVKVALSPVSTANAQLNLEAETAGMNFNAVNEKVRRNWDKELSCIEVESKDETKKRIFYTALYHCFIAPNVYCDVNGDYQGMDHKVYRDTVHQRYTVFSLWDTYRALHPLFTIVQQKRTNDFINTFLQQYKESGRLPVWELSSNETDCMIGYHSVSVIADAWMKGLTDYDTTLALEAMVSSAMQDRIRFENLRICLRRLVHRAMCTTYER
jgi:predicted alpha-1,2-mannosidase